MQTITNRRTLATTIGTVSLVATISLSACGAQGDNGSDSTSAGPGQPQTAQNVADISTDPAARNLLPKSIRDKGKLILGTTQVTGTAGLPHTGVQGGQEVGLDLDIRAAVAKKLGITFVPHTGTFATIVPGVQNGKYDVGQANFGVTADRLRIVDFATYLNDGQSFVGSSSVTIDSVKTLLDVCGLKIATTPGTTFQKLLETNKAKCAEAGKKPYAVQYFADTAPIYLGLQNGKVDVFFGPTLSLKVLTQRLKGTKYLGQSTSTPVGFVTPKNSPITKALSVAVNDLIKDGSYAQIFRKWGVAESVIKTSQINPKPTF